MDPRECPLTENSRPEPTTNVVLPRGGGFTRTAVPLVVTSSFLKKNNQVLQQNTCEMRQDNCAKKQPNTLSRICYKLGRREMSKKSDKIRTKTRKNKGGQEKKNLTDAGRRDLKVPPTRADWAGKLFLIYFALSCPFIFIFYFIQIYSFHFLKLCLIM